MMDGYDDGLLAAVEDMGSSQRMILFCIGALDRPLNGKVDVQKIVFLSSRSLPEVFGDMYTFQKHKLGPYSELLDEDLSVISNSGYVTGSGFELSPEGRDVYEVISDRIKEPLRSTIMRHKEFIDGMTEDELLTFIYVVFPEFTENSEEWGRLEPNRVECAVSLVQKEKVTASLAAKIADVNYFDFEKILDERNIRWKS